MKINLGCGSKKLTGYVNVDIIQSADVICDLENGVLPFPDNSVKEVRADQVFEHINNFIPLMNEIHRVLAPGGKLRGHVPLAGTSQAFQDPTHVRFFVPDTFAYWQKGCPLHEEHGNNYGIYPFSLVKCGVIEDWILIFELTK